jgi:hypothetical protein
VVRLVFPDVDPRFDIAPRRLFGPFWSLRIVDRTTGRPVHVTGGAFLTGYGSVRRAAKHSTRLYLILEQRRLRKGRR